jgi:hypothetical protein
LLSRHQDAEQNPDITTGNTSFENVAQFKYLGMTVTNHSLVQEEIKRKLNTSNNMNVKKKYTKAQFFLLSCMGVKICL